jgi:hypothetical protein
MTDENAVVPVLEFSDAKTHLSDVMSDVVRNHRPSLISRHHGKESMILLNADDIDAILRQHRFEVGLIFSEGEVTADLPALGLLGFGSTSDEALADLLSELRVYAGRYFTQPSLYMNSERRQHLPWLLRFAMTPYDQQSLLLVETPSSSLQR